MTRRDKRKLDGHYQAEGFVSAWLGTFPDEAAFEHYFEENWQNLDAHESPTCLFWKDLGIRWFDHDFQEGEFVGAPMPVRKLLERPWSHVESFREPLLEACREKGVHSANAVMFLYDYDFPEEAGYSAPHMKFVGTFSYSAADA